jgi:hypothetical protein
MGLRLLGLLEKSQPINDTGFISPPQGHDASSDQHGPGNARAPVFLAQQMPAQQSRKQHGHFALDAAPMRIAFNRIPDLDTER